MEPIHIDNECEDCGATLTRDPEWLDEFTCSAGCDGVYLDWSDDEVDRIVGLSRS